MYDRINYWSDVPRQVIENISWPSDRTHLSIDFEDGKTLDVESSEIGMPVRLVPLYDTEGDFDWMDLVGLRIKRVDVPYAAEGYRGEMMVVLHLESDRRLGLASQDPTVPLRLS